MKDTILQEIEKRKDIYKKSPSDMISAYNRELGTEKDYNGRQLLELLQNADDEVSDEVLIELNTKNNILKISNRGINCSPFTQDGIRSLMISNLSPKVTKKYIGNKGLGFRSIINWSKKITINSNGLDIVFSKDIVDKIYDELFGEKEHLSFIQARNLSKDIRPIPLLSIPRVYDKHQEFWNTTITIKYKQDFLEDIENQINELEKEVLLFLNSIKVLVVNIDGKVTKNIEKDKLSETWTIYEKMESLPKYLWDKDEEEESFHLKLFVQHDIYHELVVFDLQS